MRAGFAGKSILIIVMRTTAMSARAGTLVGDEPEAESSI